MKVTNPYTLETHEIQETSSVSALYDSAQTLCREWSGKPIRERVQLLQQACTALEERQEVFARLITNEVGKPISLSRFELERALEEWRYMLANAEEFLKPEEVDGGEIHFSPLGVVAVISPWNFPILLPLRGIVPALLAGNVALFKPSEVSPRTGIALASVFEEIAPLLVAVGGKEMGAELVKLPVQAIAFTGSTAVGKAIAKEASESLKRVVLELGGLDAAIVLADADVALAAHEIVRNNARNTGQVCNAIKRALVHESIVESFVKHAIEASQQLVYGDPTDERTEVGPLVSKIQYERVKSFLEDAVSKGAKAWSRAIPSYGLMFSQTILTEVPHSARLLSEEPFGPLLPIIPFSSEEEAIQIANGTRFGLTASVWTRDPVAAKKMAAELTVGLVRHNSHAAMKSGIPWGGAKESGVGRMKTKEGLREFTNVKVVA